VACRGLMPSASKRLWYSKFNLTVVILLVTNIAVFAAKGTLSEGLETPPPPPGGPH
jgi:hypothetical protein